ncbi:protein of unknown function [Methylacidimicrobium sp. AP8]|nr:protein of unknown function [Methylacidimicrobium sp. AP8]
MISVKQSTHFVSRAGRKAGEFRRRYAPVFCGISPKAGYRDWAWGKLNALSRREALRKCALRDPKGTEAGRRRLVFFRKAAAMEMLPGLPALVATGEDLLLLVARQAEQGLGLQARIERILG